MCLAAVAALVAVALDLACKLLEGEIQRMHNLGRGVACAQRHALQVQGHLGDVAVGNTGVALLVDLDLQACQRRHLAVDLARTTLRGLADLVGDGNVATLEVDLHHTPPFAGEMLPMAVYALAVTRPNLSWTFEPLALALPLIAAGAYLWRW